MLGTECRGWGERTDCFEGFSIVLLYIPFARSDTALSVRVQGLSFAETVKGREGLGFELCRNG